MLSRYIIPYTYLADNTAGRLKAIEKNGIDPHTLIVYSLNSLSCDSRMEYAYVSSHISKDIIEVFPDVRFHASEYRRLLHQCIECAFELRQRVLDIVRGYTNDPMLTQGNLRFEQFHGDDISILVTQ